MDYMGNWGNKDPDETKAFAIDWTDNLLPGDSPNVVTWTVLEGSVVKSSQTKSGNITSIRISGGIDQESCRVSCHVVTTNNEILEGTMRLDIRTR